MSVNSFRLEILAREKSSLSHYRASNSLLQKLLYQGYKPPSGEAKYKRSENWQVNFESVRDPPK